MNINELWDKYKVGMMDKNKTVREVMIKTDFIVAIGELISLPLELPVSQENGGGDVNYKKVYDKFGKTHTIEKRMGTSVNMEELKDNQSVCWGDGISYHFLLTEKG